MLKVFVSEAELLSKPHGGEPSRVLRGIFLLCSRWGHPLEICQEFCTSGFRRVCDWDPTNWKAAASLVWVGSGCLGGLVSLRGQHLGTCSLCTDLSLASQFLTALEANYPEILRNIIVVRGE